MGCSICTEACAEKSITQELEESFNRSVDKHQIVVIIALKSSLLKNMTTVDNHSEYQVSRFTVIEQLKITAKSLKSKTIYNAIQNSNNSYRYSANSFYNFLISGTSPLYKQMTEVSCEANDSLQPGKVYYLFIEGDEDIEREIKDEFTKKKGELKFKRLSFSWKNQKDAAVQNVSVASTNSDTSDPSKVVLDRKYRYSIVNSMQTIKEVDSFNTSTINHSLSNFNPI